MDKYKRIPLRTFKHKKLYYNQIIITEYLKKIEEIINDTFDIENIEFAKRVIETIPKQELTFNTESANKYILQTPTIDKDTLRELYNILSKDELKEEEKKSLGKYYRTTEEYISTKKSLDVKKIGANPEEVEKYMDILIEFINSDNDIDEFIKSQIIHIYFVYIHPYPNINGRTSRLLSSWHLITKQKYPLVIFDRIPSFSPSNYSKSIKSIYHHGNITPFLTFMLKSTTEELKVISQVEKIMPISKIDDESLKILEYIHLLKHKDLKSISKIYNFFSRFIMPSQIEEKVKKLSQKEILIKEKDEYKIKTL